MTNFIFYPNEAYNKNKRITALYPLMGGVMSCIGAYSVLKGEYMAGGTLLIGGSVFLTTLLVYSLPAFKYSSYYMVDQKLIGFKSNLFCGYKEIPWAEVKTVRMTEASAVIQKKNGTVVEIKPDMLSYHDLQLFANAIKENAELNTVAFAE
ncbi:hypothetical protein EMN47_08040 [Prolixibacteraceae bacterium JC049]|nr:hypothetical protein [Prolixibacteraceae bacterium JC049]